MPVKKPIWLLAFSTCCLKPENSNCALSKSFQHWRCKKANGREKKSTPQPPLAPLEKRVQLHIQVLHLKFTDLYRCARMNTEYQIRISNTQRVALPVAQPRWASGSGSSTWVPQPQPQLHPLLSSISILVRRHETEADVERAKEPQGVYNVQWAR